MMISIWGVDHGDSVSKAWDRKDTTSALGGTGAAAVGTGLGAMAVGGRRAKTASRRWGEAGALMDHHVSGLHFGAQNNLPGYVVHHKAGIYEQGQRGKEAASALKAGKKLKTRGGIIAGGGAALGGIALASRKRS